MYDTVTAYVFLRDKLNDVGGLHLTLWTGRRWNKVCLYCEVVPSVHQISIHLGPRSVRLQSRNRGYSAETGPFGRDAIYIVVKPYTVGPCHHYQGSSKQAQRFRDAYYVSKCIL